MIELQEIRADGASVAAQLADRIWHEHYEGILDPGQIDYMVATFQSATSVAAQIAEGYRYFLVRDDGAYIGYFAVQARETDMFLSKLYLIKPARGQGYGRSCVQFVRELARAARCSTVSLTVNVHNARSIAVYKKWGFAVTGQGVTDIGNGYVMDDYYMSLRV